MSWWGKLLNIGTAGITGTLGIGMGNGKKKADPYQALLDQLNPLIKAQTDATTKSTAAGLENVKAGRNDLDFVSDWFKKQLTGTDDELLKQFDVSGLTRNIDENVQQQSESGVRGGARAAVIGGSYFNRDAAINRALQQLRFMAPDKIAAIAGQIGNLGLGELGAGTSASGAASQDIFGIQQLRQQDKDRKAALIGSILEAVGGGLGAYFGAK